MGAKVHVKALYGPSDRSVESGLRLSRSHGSQRKVWI